jgi:hypothetical protein|tara:strand:- start:127 stop:327 length:201 start_codon:yes stop_codon:yes gene_type:complete
MKSRDVERRNIPKGSLVELRYIDPIECNEPVYFEGVERKRKYSDGVDMLLCREPNTTRLIKKNWKL